jgi:hypothetical protein
MRIRLEKIHITPTSFLVLSKTKNCYRLIAVEYILTLTMQSQNDHKPIKFFIVFESGYLATRTSYTIR